MSETKIFCSVIVFTLGVYTIILLQYELFKLNHLNNGGSSEKHNHHTCNSSVPKTKLNLDRLNCGSAGDVISLAIQNCSELPCDIIPDVNYTVVLQFSPSRNVSTLEIQTYVRQKRDLKYLHKETLSVQATERTNATLKFSFTFPAHHLMTSKKKVVRCPAQNLFMVGLEIWDVPSGIGEVCMVVPMTVQ